MTNSNLLAALLLALALLLSQWLWMANARIAQLQALLAEQHRIEKIECDIADIKGLLDGMALGAGIKNKGGSESGSCPTP